MNERAQRFTLAARQFLRANPRLVAIVCLGCASVFALPRVTTVVVGLLARETIAEDSYRTELARQRQIYHAILPERDSVRKEAAKSRIIYVAKRRGVLDAIAALPPASVAGDTITIRGTPFPVQHEVALYVAEQAAIIAAVPPTLVSADTALSQSVQAGVLSDSAATVADRIVTTVEEHEKGPGFFRRAWNAVKVPVAFVSGTAIGVAIGVVVGKAAK